MRRHQLLLVVFIVVSLALAPWLFANWYVHGMAEFDCADRTFEVNACARAIQRPIELQAIVALLAWAASGVLLIREWKKA